MAEQKAPEKEQQTPATQAPAEQKAPEERPAASKPATQTKAPGLVVTGAAAVLKLKGGGEQYLYRGAAVDAARYTPESVKHNQAVGLVGKPAK